MSNCWSVLREQFLSGIIGRKRYLFVEMMMQVIVQDKHQFTCWAGFLLQILDRISLQYAPNANERKTQTKRTNASHERFEKCTMHETNARYTNEWNETNELYEKCKRTNARCMKRTNDTRNKCTIHERTNHWSVTMYYSMTNDPGSVEVQYSIVLLFEWFLCKLMWLTNLIFYTQLITDIYKW